MRRLIRSASLTGYAEIAANAGLDAGGMLAEFHLPPAALREPEVKVSADAVRRLLEASARRSRVECFGLLMAEKRRLAHLGPLGLLVREQPTMHHAMQAMVRYANRVSQAVFVTIEEGDEVVVLRTEVIVGGPGAIRQATELTLGIVFLALREVLPAFEPLRVCMAHDPPANREAHRRIFGDRVEFGQDLNGIVCSRRDLAITNPGADPVMARYAREMVESSFRARPLMTDHVRELVLAQLAAGACSIEVAAKQIGVSRRTLHRQLAREGHTFSQIVDDMRRELAARYVADRHRSLAEVSELLGFAAPSGFSRWYRRQFSTSASAAGTRARKKRKETA